MKGIYDLEIDRGSRLKLAEASVTPRSMDIRCQCAESSTPNPIDPPMRPVEHWSMTVAQRATFCHGRVAADGELVRERVDGIRKAIVGGLSSTSITVLTGHSSKSYVQYRISST